MENYRKIKIVGKGSFGSAILVQSNANRKFYIMKIIDVSQMNRQQREEAINEVTLLKTLAHPFIITYRESFMDKNRYLCIVMEYADNGDLHQQICDYKKKGKRIPEEQILNWFIQICYGLKHIHDQKVLHRDLKTQNIFLTLNGQIKIGDFGIAKILQNTLDCAQTAIGTPYYLSPEICQEKPYNQKSDIWSLGCILYELMTLRHAFDAQNMQGLMIKILRGSYPSLPSCYSQELKDLVYQMLHKDPAERPSITKLLSCDFISQKTDQYIYKLIKKKENDNQQQLKNSFDSQQPMSFLKECQLNTNRDQTVKDQNKFDDINLKSQNNVLNECILQLNSQNQSIQSKFEEDLSMILKSLKEEDSDEEFKVDDINNNNKKEKEIKNNFKFSQQQQNKESEDDIIIEKFLQIKNQSQKEESIYYRIEALRIYLEKQLGDNIFIQAYNLISKISQIKEDTNMEEVHKLIPENKHKFIPLIYQLFVCEDTYFDNNII